MPIIGLPNREQLTSAVVDAIEQVLASVTGFLYTEHKDDGSHGDVTADSVTSGEVDTTGGRIVLPNGDTLDAADDGGLQIARGSGQVLSIGSPNVAFDGVPHLHTTSHVDLYVERRLLLGARFSESGPWPALSLFGSTQPSSSAADGVYTTLFRAVPTANDTIDSIYKPVPNSVSGHPDGQMIVIWNDSAYQLTLHDSVGIGGVGSSGHCVIINGPAVLGPQGAAVLVYEAEYDWPSANGFGGWRIVATYKDTALGAASADTLDVSGDVTCDDLRADGSLFEEGSATAVGDWQTYDPTFASTGTQPTDFTDAGRYMKIGDTYIVEASVICGASFTAGTGTYQISLPVTMTTPANAVKSVGTAMIYDNDTGEYWLGVVRQNGSGAVTIIPDGSRAAIGPTNPITFAASDQIGFRMILERA